MSAFTAIPTNLSQQECLNYAEIAIFAALIPVTVYCFIRHHHGRFGWFYLNLFCLLRIIGCALLVSSEKKHTTSIAALIISGVGLSPLLFSSISIVHEA